MGNAIVYCTGCRKQIRRNNSETGTTYRVRDQLYCPKCARKEVRRMPDAARRQILARIEAARAGSSKGSKTSLILRELVVARAGHRRPVPRSDSRLLGLLLGAAGIFLLLAALVASAGASRQRPRSDRPLPSATNPDR